MLPECVSEDPGDFPALEPRHLGCFAQLPCVMAARDSAAAGRISRRVCSSSSDTDACQVGHAAGGAAVVRSRQLRAGVVLGRRAKRRGRTETGLTILLHRSRVVRVTSRALIVSASSCMSHSLVARHVLHRIHVDGPLSVVPCCEDDSDGAFSEASCCEDDVDDALSEVVVP